MERGEGMKGIPVKFIQRRQANCPLYSIAILQLLQFLLGVGDKNLLHLVVLPKTDQFEEIRRLFSTNERKF